MWIIASETNRNITSNKKEDQVENNTDLPELIVAEGLAFSTSGFCLGLFREKGRMITLCLMSVQTELDTILNIHHKSQGNSQSFF